MTVAPVDKRKIKGVVTGERGGGSLQAAVMDRVE
jgi:hypothetical protein